MKNTAVIVLLGLAGFALGYAYGARVREATPGRIKTEFTGGQVRVTFDAAGAASDGLLDLLKGK